MQVFFEKLFWEFIFNYFFIIADIANDKTLSKEVFSATNEKYPTYDAYDSDIAMVTFFFDKSEYPEYGKEERMTLIQFISQIGGLMGLCMGFSFISAIEIFYWFILRYFRSI